MFEQLQLITRYCSIERPYADAFFKYYKANGLQLIHLVVQSDKEKEEAEELSFKHKIDSTISLFPENISPDAALSMFDRDRLSSDLPITMFADMDEYIYDKKKSKNWSKKIYRELKKNNKAVKLLWHMNLNDDLLSSTHPEFGFRGHNGKQIALTTEIKNFNPRRTFAGAHNILKKRTKIIDSCAIAHVWSRGFTDSLLKVFFSRMQSFKTSDQNNARELIKAGKIPNRLVILAFLSCQSRQIKSPDLIKGCKYDHNLAMEMLLNYLEEELAFQCFENYKLYKNKLDCALKENNFKYHPYPGGLKDLRRIGKALIELKLQ